MTKKEDKLDKDKQEIMATNYKLELKKITKDFPGIRACDSISLKVKEGTIHAIAGENGAGKSTLMSIVFGLYKPTSGSIHIDGKKVNIKNPMHANKLGVGMVHQHFKLVSIFNAVENIILGSEPVSNKVFVDKGKAFDKIDKIMKRYNLNIPLTPPSENLTVGQQQKLEILKILYREANLLVFDEPTAVLTPAEIKSLLKILLQFKKDGKTILLITHKLEEIKAVADEVTVIRHGKVVDSFPSSKLTSQRLSKAITGKEIEPIKLPTKTKGNVVLKVKDLCTSKFSHPELEGLKNVSFEIKEGEILAIAGVEGNGQTELGLAIAGMMPIKGGEIIFEGSNITKTTTKQRYGLGFSHIPADRHKHGVVLDWNLFNNSVLQDFDTKKYANGIFVNKSNFVKHARDIIKNYDVRGTKKGRSLLRSLSGGNQQKFIVGRELMREHTKFLLITQPTRGLDVGAIQYIHSSIIKARADNKAILLISYELSEIMDLADNILVINEGRVSQKITRKEATIDRIGQYMVSSSKEKSKVKKGLKNEKIN